MQTIHLTSKATTTSNFNKFITRFKKKVKLSIRKIGREMQKHADEAGQAMRS